jgi:hypothetical protein
MLYNLCQQLQMVWLMFRHVTGRNGVEVGRQYQAVSHLNSGSVFSCVVHETQVINTLRG